MYFGQGHFTSKSYLGLLLEIIGLLLFSTSSHTAPTESYVPFTHTPKVGTIDQSGQEANFCWMNLVGRVNLIGRSIKGIVVETSRQKSLKKLFFWVTILTHHLSKTVFKTRTYDDLKERHHCNHRRLTYVHCYLEEISQYISWLLWIKRSY